MSAKHVLLGLLKEGPAYPYQFEDRLQDWLGPGWRINSGQVYQTIDRLAKAGLIERLDGSVLGRHDRHIFDLTESGIEEFERWRRKRGARAVGPLRRPVLAKLMFAGPEDRQDALAQIDAYERACTECLAELAHELEAIPEDTRELKAGPEGAPVRAEDVIRKLALDLEIDHYQSEQAWCPGAREAVAWLYEQDAVWRPGSDGRRLGWDRNARESQNAREELFGRIARRPRSERKRRS